MADGENSKREIHKCKCNFCNWQGKDNELHEVQTTDGNSYLVCPKCHGLENTCYTACDFSDCWNEVTCGTPTPDGYRTTCGKHKPGPNKQNENNGNVKLEDHEVGMIRLMSTSGFSVKEILSVYPVSDRQIRRIIKGEQRNYE